MSSKNLFIICSLLWSVNSAIAQCPSITDINGSSFTVSGDCSITTPALTQGLSLTYDTLRIPSGSKLTVTGLFIVFDRVEVDGMLEVFGDMEVRSPKLDTAAVIELGETGSVIVHGDYTNGTEDILTPIASLGELGTTNIRGPLSSSGTYANKDGGVTNIFSSGSMQSSAYNKQGGTVYVEDGADSDCNTGCCGGGCGPLPVTLLGFNAELSQDYATVKWSTATEINNDYFILQKMEYSDNQFRTIGIVKGANNSTEIENYRFIDHFYNESCFYRLIQKDLDGTADTIRTISFIKNEKNAEMLAVYPNPVKDNLYLKGNHDQIDRLKLINASGKTLIDSNDFNNKIEIENMLADVLAEEKGHFILQVFMEENAHYIRFCKH